MLTERLLYTLFAFLFALLLLSNLVIAYTNLFRNRETAFLLTLPVSDADDLQLEIHRVHDAGVVGVFVFDRAAAGGVRAGARRAVAFLSADGAADRAVHRSAGRVRRGAGHRHRAASGPAKVFKSSLLVVALVLLAFVAFWWKTNPVDDDLLDKRTLEALDRLLAKTRFTMFPFLPSYWLSSAVLQWAEGILQRRGIFRGGAVEPHACFSAASRSRGLASLFYDTASAVQSRARRRVQTEFFPHRKSTRRTPGLLEKLFGKISCSCSRDTRALAVKDLRMFWRDTTQWGQSVMFFGLLGAYIINLRNFTHQLTSPFWINAVAFLNLGACAFNLASVTTRFVFPQFSLEGRRLWIVGMSPMGLERIVKTKYWLASTLSLVVTLGLDHALVLPAENAVGATSRFSARSSP